MDFSYSEEQSMLLASCERLVRERCSFEARRALTAQSPQTLPPLWAEFAQLGLTALRVPEAAGGMDRPLIDGVLVAQALGRGWLLEPFVDCALAAVTTLARAPQSEAGAAALAEIAEGKAVIVALDAVRTENGRVHGIASHANYADALLALDGDRLLLLQTEHATQRGWRQFDGSAAAQVECALDAETITLAQGEAAEAAWHAGRQVARVGRIAEGMGLARTVLDLTAEYLRTRKQFGQPIGRFQALAHRMADLATQYEMAQSLMLAAAMKVETADGDRTLDAAQVIAHRTLRAIGQQAIQLHGGIGMTDELAVSHYVKRLLAIELELGDVDTALSRFAAAAH